MKAGVVIVALAVGGSAARAEGDFAYAWLDRCLTSALGQKRPTGAENQCMKDAARICEFSENQNTCLADVAASANASANNIVQNLPEELPGSAPGAAFYAKRLAKVKDEGRLLVCNPPLGAPPEHCDAMTAMWRYSSARSLSVLVSPAENGTN